MKRKEVVDRNADNETDQRTHKGHHEHFGHNQPEHIKGRRPQRPQDPIFSGAFQNRHEDCVQHPDRNYQDYDKEHNPSSLLICSHCNVERTRKLLPRFDDQTGIRDHRGDLSSNRSNLAEPVNHDHQFMHPPHSTQATLAHRQASDTLSSGP